MEPFAMPLHKLDSFEGRKALARLLRDWQRSDRKNRSYTALARKAGLSAATVQKIASETTVWPRLHTILAILSAIGFSMVRFE